jgi:hypothetical protein
MNFLKYCDFFDIKFHFYVGGHPSNSNIFGGIMSILFCISAILLMLILSIEDLKKLNPITSKSEVPGADIKVVNLHDSKVWVPWRMVTYEEKFIDHRGILHPVVSFVEGKWNSSFGMDLTYHTLNYKLCNETSMANKTKEYKIDIPLNECFCIDNDDIPWGGSWHSDILYYFEVNLYTCEGGIDFNPSDPRCTHMSELLKHRNTSWLFEFYYPVVQFEPTNHENPISVIYRSYFYRLSSYANKVERIYIQENIMEDDQSIIKSAPVTKTYWGITNVYGDTYFTPEEKDMLVKSVSSRLYSLVVYMDQGYVRYTSKYKNVIIIFSEILPLVNVLLIAFKIFTRYIKLTVEKKNLTEIIFENLHEVNVEKPMPRKNRNGIEKKIFEDMKPKTKIRPSKIFLNLKKNNAEQNCSSMVSLNIESIKNANMNSNITPNEKENEKSKNNYLKLFPDNNDNNGNEAKPISSDLNVIRYLNKNQLKGRTVNEQSIDNNLMQELNISIIKRPKRVESKKNYIRKQLFPVSYYYMNIIFDRLIKPKSFFCLDKKYFIMYNFMVKFLDVASHITMLKYFIIFKDFFISNVVSNSKKKHLFDLDKKINISDEKKMELIENINEKDEDIFSNPIFK